ncbi:envelope protein [Alphacoronavirus HCQD-2020]|nr:envelope protein [Alphacoronavirus HCQD-2020]UNE74443.1 E protein [Eptesicus bat coronavirus]URD31239.1 envelope protein [Pipistrellus bat coronavirus]UNE74450.1 E protein [Eptesicus bat coronavirus]UNE74457.1 E protein [Eptesicus bat coronavirus]
MKNFTKMLFKIVDDNGFAINAILWLLILLFILLISVTLLKLIQLCFACHQFASRTVYVPIRRVYNAYQTFMQIDPCPIVDV